MINYSPKPLDSEVAARVMGVHFEEVGFDPTHLENHIEAANAGVSPVGAVAIFKLRDYKWRRTEQTPVIRSSLLKACMQAARRGYRLLPQIVFFYGDDPLTPDEMGEAMEKLPARAVALLRELEIQLGRGVGIPIKITSCLVGNEWQLTVSDEVADVYPLEALIAKSLQESGVRVGIGSDVNPTVTGRTLLPRLSEWLKVRATDPAFVDLHAYLRNGNVPELAEPIHQRLSIYPPNDATDITPVHFGESAFSHPRHNEELTPARLREIFGKNAELSAGLISSYCSANEWCSMSLFTVRCATINPAIGHMINAGASGEVVSEEIIAELHQRRGFDLVGALRQLSVQSELLRADTRQEWLSSVLEKYS